MIQIISPVKLTTGGTELLHQLNFELEKLGADVCMAYYDKQSKMFVEVEINPNFEKYSSLRKKSVNLKDSKDSVIVVAETMLKHVKNIKNAKIYVWWLSVDNYKVNLNIEYLKDYGYNSFIYEIKKALTIVPLSKLRSYKHLVQSKYAHDYLMKNKISSEYLTDYINTQFTDSKSIHSKSNIICYNPVKGKNVTKKIIDYFSTKENSAEFVPIKNMTPQQVAETLQSAKIYIDFGWHPGKDRIPREARLQNCVIITGRRGSANNDVDIKIPQKFKFNEKDNRFLEDIYDVIMDVFKDFDKNIELQAEYKAAINDEKKIFENEVIRFYGEVNKKSI